MNVRGMLVVGVCLLIGGVVQAATTDNFDPPNPAVTATQSGSAPGPAVAGPDAGSTGQFLRLINNINSQANHYAYDQTDVGLFTNITVDFDFRASSPAPAADGVALMLLPTATYGATGAGVTGYFGVEEPNIANTFAIGIDLHPAGSVNDISAHFNGAEWRNVTVNPAQVDFDNGVFHRARVQVTHTPLGARVRADVTNDINGAASPTVTPFVTFIPGMLPYDSRVQVSGRTGGLNVDFDLDNINVQYTNPYAPPAVSPTTLFQDFDSTGGTPATFVQLGTAPRPVVYGGGPTGNHLRLINDGAGNQRNAIAFDRAPDGGVSDTFKGTFDFRGSGTNVADGFSMVLLPTAAYGNSGGGANPSPAEKPNVAGAFAVGFDFYPYNVNTNDVSVHFNGAQIQNIPISPAVLDMDNNQFHRVEVMAQHVAGGSNVTINLIPDVHGTPGTPVNVVNNLFVAGMIPYDYRVEFAGRTGGANMNVDLDNIISGVAPGPVTPGTQQNFDGGGSHYKAYTSGSATHPAVMTGGPDGNYLRLAHAVNSQSNQVGFNQNDPGLYQRTMAEFDFRVTTAGSQADGVGFLLADVSQFGRDGRPPVVSEDPNLARSFGIGLDVYQNGPEPNANHVTLHYNGSQVAVNDLASTGLNLSSGQFHRAQLELAYVPGGSKATLTITPDIHGTPGAPVEVFKNLFLPGVTPVNQRLVVGARTGGAHANFDLDNINVTSLPSLTGFNYQPDFSGAGASHFTFNNNGAGFTGLTTDGAGNNVIQVTNNIGNQMGSAWLNRKQFLADGFVSEFTFEMANGVNGGADGLSFVIQNTGTGLLVGEEGPGGGALTVAIDAWNNGAGVGDPSIAHVSVRTGSAVGDILATADLIPLGIDLQDDGPHTVRVEYAPGDLDVIFDEFTLLSDLNVDLAALGLLDAGGEAFVGFGARTGGAAQDHNVLAWSLVTTQPIPEPATMLCLLAGAVGLGGYVRRRRTRRA